MDFAMFQLPGVRRDLNPGNLTGRDLAELLPYTEYVSTFNITGKKFKQAVQDSLKCNPDGKNYSMFAYSDNLYIEYKCRPNNKKHPVKVTKMLLNGKKMSGRKTYRVEGMHCAHCKARVESVCKGVEGAVDAVVDLQKKQVTVTGNASAQALKKAIVDAGYQVVD